MAYSVDIYDKKGKVVSKVDLNEEIYSDGIINESLIHEYYLLQTSNARINIACVKGRGEVNGSWKKLYKQKGTGNARTGGKQAPIRRGGWVAFGPRGDRNFTKGMNKKAKKLALAGMITIKAKESALLGLDEFVLSTPKTKAAIEILNNIGVQNAKVLVVLNNKNDNATKSLRNIPSVKYVSVGYLNPFDILSADKIVFEQAALEAINTK